MIDIDKITFDELERAFNYLDQTVQDGQTVELETEFGTISVHKSRHRGYYAMLNDARRTHEFSNTPSEAFLELARTLDERSSNPRIT